MLKRFEQIVLPAKLPDYHLCSNQSNIIKRQRMQTEAHVHHLHTFKFPLFDVILDLSTCVPYILRRGSHIQDFLQLVCTWPADMVSLLKMKYETFPQYLSDDLLGTCAPAL